MNLWRMHLRTGIGDISSFCFDKRIVGLGWPVDSEPVSKDAYLIAYRQKYGSRKKGAVEAFASDINEKEDLLWVRKGMTYFLGKVGAWKCGDSQEIATRGIGSVRPYDWAEIGPEDCVPGSVVTNFIKGPAFRRIGNKHALEYSRYIFAKAMKHDIPTSRVDQEGILDLIGPEDLEDVVAIYLQLVEGCVLFPSTFKKGTKGVEGYGVSRSDLTLIGWQVKTGKDTIDEDKFATIKGKVFLLQLEKWPDTPTKPPCIRLRPDDIRNFLLDPNHKQLMPKKIQTWIDYVQAGG